MLVDSHAHLFLEEFDSDREQVIKRSLDAGVKVIVNAGIDVDSSEESIRLAGIYSGLLASVGIHPQNAASSDNKAVEQIKQIARDKNVVAIGEIGLDYYRGNLYRNEQLEMLVTMLDIAYAEKLPAILHCRSAEEDMSKTLERWAGRTRPVRGKWRGIRHCFGENLETALRYIDMGFMLSFGAYVGYPSSKHLRPVLEKLPSDSFLLETDCPYLPPQKLRGKRNEPSYLPLTADVIAKIRGVTPLEISRETTANAQTMFGLSAFGDFA